jgi:hypothetical protein
LKGHFMYDNQNLPLIDGEDGLKERCLLKNS